MIEKNAAPDLFGELERLRHIVRCHEKTYEAACEILGASKFALGPEPFLPEIARLRKLEAAVLDLSHVIETEVCAFAPHEDLQNAIDEARRMLELEK